MLKLVSDQNMISYSDTSSSHCLSNKNILKQKMFREYKNLSHQQLYIDLQSISSQNIYQINGSIHEKLELNF